MEQISTFGIEILSTRLLHSTSAESILKRLKINYVLPGSLYQLVIFLRRLVVISNEIRLLFAKLWLTHRRVTFIKKNHVANLPEKDCKVSFFSTRLRL